ncbi:MAG: hypothetical protein ACRD0C_22420 [Acidimicrobiia bacterium]
MSTTESARAPSTDSPARQGDDPRRRGRRGHIRSPEAFRRIGARRRGERSPPCRIGLRRLQAAGFGINLARAHRVVDVEHLLALAAGAVSEWRRRRALTS